MERAKMKRFALVAGSAALAVALVALLMPKPASAESTVVSYDMSAWDTSETRSAGHLKITSEGLHVWTDDATSDAKAAGYRSPVEGANLSNVGTPTLEWDGTSPAPGLQIILDVPEGTGRDGILVGESAYGNNWWLTNGSTQELKDKAPHTGGGNGSNWFGTLAEWNTALGGDGWISKIGFSLGSGVKGEGVIKSLTFNGVKYTFKKRIEIDTEEPGYTPPTCYRVGKVVLPETEGVLYTVKTDERRRTTTVTASAKEGYLLKEDAKVQWSFPIAKLRGEQCETDATASPSATPTMSSTPTPPPTTSAPEPTPTVSTTSVASVSGSGGGGLPLTGDKTMLVLTLGTLAVAAGAAMLLLARRDRQIDTTEG